ncbi:uncharacterized protein LOC129585298 [Paramacrobiotus metropolitanus]|uniref:uncharacterized protein LOC129585298 n=1 Tax=Paramacrobiotus metropolitanus TaxID=2943436 RepID=UPI002445955E|nr:uncharacterized protein LOC129585298 [Paramacrobiotus metropolitanus]
MPLMRSCGMFALKTGCYLVAAYTFMVAILLFAFNIYDYINAADYLAWSRIVSFVAASGLLIAALCLVVGLRLNSPALHLVWLILFGFYMVFQITAFAYTLFFYADDSEQPVRQDDVEMVPPSVKTSTLAYIIVFGILTLVNILCLIAVQSHRDLLFTGI